MGHYESPDLSLSQGAATLGIHPSDYLKNFLLQLRKEENPLPSPRCFMLTLTPETELRVLDSSPFGILYLFFSVPYQYSPYPNIGSNSSSLGIN